MSKNPNPRSRWTDNPFREPNLPPERLEWLNKRDEALRRFRSTGDKSLAIEIGLFPKEKETEAEFFTAEEPLIIICINQTWEKQGPYHAVRGVWRIAEWRIEKYGGLVLAHVKGVVKGAYRPTVWLPGIRRHFPFEIQDYPDKRGFTGYEAEPEVWQKYVGKRVPDRYQPWNTNPVRYCHPNDEKE